MLEPVKGRVRVTSGPDWTLRNLRATDADLPLGFDPLFYPGIASDGDELPPFRLGAHKHWDDHPLATRRWRTTTEYLAAPAEALWVQAAAHAIWYIRASFLERALDHAFDWIAYLHERLTPIDAWTLDASKIGPPALAQRLASVASIASPQTTRPRSQRNWATRLVSKRQRWKARQQHEVRPSRHPAPAGHPPDSAGLSPLVPEGLTYTAWCNELRRSPQFASVPLWIELHGQSTSTIKPHHLRVFLLQFLTPRW